MAEIWSPLEWHNEILTLMKINLSICLLSGSDVSERPSPTTVFTCEKKTVATELEISSVRATLNCDFLLMVWPNLLILRAQ